MRFRQLYFLLVLILFLTIRLILIWNDWPLLNSDEGTMGIMAIHIVHGAHPIFFYGQNYMGTLEAYVGAVLFNVSGISTFSLRLGLVLLLTCFVICMYTLIRRLYTEAFALFVTFLMCFGSNAVLSRQLMALGGYVETLLLASMAFLIAHQLATNSTIAHSSRKAFLGYIIWGFVTGVGLWSDLLIIPWIICSCMILLLFCRKELFKGGIWGVIIGLVSGSLPLIIYNISAAPGQNSWSILIAQQGSVPFTPGVFMRQLEGTLQISIPTITGSPFCHYEEFANIKMLGFEQSHPITSLCSTVGVMWSLVYLGLLCTFIFITVIRFAKIRHYLFSNGIPVVDKSELVNSTTVLLLALCALFNIILYIHSHSPVDEPAEYSRYLIMLWLVSPLVLWPIWISSVKVKYVIRGGVSLQLKVRQVISCIFILFIMSTLMYGTYKTLQEIPLAQAANLQENNLIQELLQHNITHVYTDYWTCDRLAFQSKEKIICGVLAGGCSLQKGFHNRYAPYYVNVSNDPYSSYLFTSDVKCDKQIADKMNSLNMRYEILNFYGYTVYHPYALK